MKPIVYCSEAQSELEEAALYYERRRDGLGTEFHEAVREAESQIQRNPLLIPVYDDEGHRECCTGRFPYTLYFLDLDERIWIAAVAHQKRRPGYWSGRSPD